MGADLPGWVPMSLLNFNLNGLGTLVAEARPPFAEVPFNSCLRKCSQKCTVWAARTSSTTLWPPLTLGVGVLEQNVSFNLPGVDVVLLVKFQPSRYSGVAAYKEHTHTHTHSHLYCID